MTTSFLAEPIVRDDWIAHLRDLPPACVVFDERMSRDDLRVVGAAVRQEGRPIAGLRNYCPRPRDLPRSKTARHELLLNAADPDRRNKAVEATLETLEWAARLEASCVIIEAGSVADESLPLARMEDSFRQGKWHGPEAQHALRLCRERRQRAAPPALEELQRSLDTILNVASRLEIPVALENPRSLAGLPSVDEYHHLYREFGGSPLGAWYDVSHARVQELLGWGTAIELRAAMEVESTEADESTSDGETPPDGADPNLENREPSPQRILAQRILGCGLEDLRGIDGGLLPGQGELDFAPPTAQIRDEVPLVLRTWPHHGMDQVLQALEHLRQLGFDGPPPEPWENHLPIIGG